MPPLSQPKNASRSLLTILAVIVFVTAMVLVILQNMGPAGGSGKIIRGYDDGYADGFRAARDQAMKLLPSIGAESPFLSGTVASVGASAVSFNVTGLIMDERADGVSSVRVANVTNQTTIVLMEDRSGEEMQAEQKAFQRAMANFEPGDALPALPSPYSETSIALGDIHEGDMVTVEAAAGQNVIPLASFEAVKISVRRAPVVPTAAGALENATPPTTPVAPSEMAPTPVPAY